jgi:hypothetical protein
MDLLQGQEKQQAAYGAEADDGGGNCQPKIQAANALDRRDRSRWP